MRTNAHKRTVLQSVCQSPSLCFVVGHTILKTRLLEGPFFFGFEQQQQRSSCQVIELSGAEVSVAKESILGTEPETDGLGELGEPCSLVSPTAES